MDKQKLNQLIDKVTQGTASNEELYLYSKYLHQVTSTNGEWDFENLGTEEAVKAELYQRLEASINDRHKRKHLQFWPRLAIAASIITVFSFGALFLLNKKYNQQSAINQTKIITPGGNKATLILGNGKKILLANAKNGKLAEQAGVKITKSANGQIIYSIADISPNLKNYPPEFNTIETPVGGQYKVNLPDGTEVWLNAASSLRYPVRFAGNERRVELKGEGYFEVAHNRLKPFKVATANQTVEVLGTHFNIMAYTDEKAIKTTLLEGSVRVANAKNTGILVPGQQSILTSNTIDVINSVDLEDVTAWKDGYFKFNENLTSVMNKVARWYNIDVVYDLQPDPDLAFGGKISRSRNIAEVLKIIEYTGKVHFKIEGRRVIVTK